MMESTSIRKDSVEDKTNELISTDENGDEFESVPVTIVHPSPFKPQLPIVGTLIQKLFSVS